VFYCPMCTFLLHCYVCFSSLLRMLFHCSVCYLIVLYVCIACLVSISCSVWLLFIFLFLVIVLYVCFIVSFYLCSVCVFVLVYRTLPPGGYPIEVNNKSILLRTMVMGNLNLLLCSCDQCEQGCDVCRAVDVMREEAQCRVSMHGSHKLSFPDGTACELMAAPLSLRCLNSVYNFNYFLDKNELTLTGRDGTLYQLTQPASNKST
jgi:hypothetical protein